MNIDALIVEDNVSWQTLLREILEDLGLTVDTAATAAEALALIRTKAYRIAVVDLSLNPIDHHNQDGLRVLDSMRQYNPACTAIMLTGYATVEIAVSVLTERGAYSCLRKETFTRSSFRTLLQQALATASITPRGATEGIEAPANGITPAAEITEKPARGRALVVDDDAGWRSILAELVEEAGYTVRLCNGFGEALGCLGRERFDVAIVDLVLSGTVRPQTASASDHVARFDALRLLTSARASGIRTIVVSGMASLSEIEGIYSEYGVFACLEKQTMDRGAFLRTLDAVHADKHSDSELDQLTDRERQILGLLAQGMTNKEIAETLVISTNTVKRHLKAVFSKLGIRTRSAAVTKALGAGITAWHEPPKSPAQP
jgi:DNA-binding NarL/FixJ family response regulator